MFLFDFVTYFCYIYEAYCCIYFLYLYSFKCYDYLFVFQMSGGFAQGKPYKLEPPLIVHCIIEDRLWQMSSENVNIIIRYRPIATYCVIGYVSFQNGQWLLHYSRFIAVWYPVELQVQTRNPGRSVPMETNSQGTSDEKL